ncbi:hypothetical protein NPIL_696211 [Nephila pilipes]|uniref:Uncharacterized protein n=1 Tax=Nephila pilipes TaxID=299642 RepID=A0A8X6IUF6_NEPPI|nr:hypothetical protein NPIL_696211 [Nephila pilipes]
MFVIRFFSRVEKKKISSRDETVVHFFVIWKQVVGRCKAVSRSRREKVEKRARIILQDVRRKEKVAVLARVFTSIASVTCIARKKVVRFTRDCFGIKSNDH